MRAVFRVDASPVIGSGHLMRCLALAQAWRRGGGSAIFTFAEITAALEARLAGEEFQSIRLSVTPGTREDSEKTRQIAKGQNASWVVADSYKFGPDYQHAIKDAGLRLLLLDDYGHAGEYVADFVLNQNLRADAALYARHAPHTKLLLDTRYALLREEFLQWRDWKREIPAVARKVLVTLGGGDPDNATGKVVEVLRRLDVEAKIVVGGSNPHFDSLSSVVRLPSSVIRDASNMPELMAWADVAVAAGGSTSWELAFMGLPSLVLVLAENQVGVAKALAASNLALWVGTAAPPLNELSANVQELLNDGPARERMSRLGRTLVDGLGGQRVVNQLIGAVVILRPAEPRDCRQVWEWANEPEVRAVSFNSEPIPWESHARWFEARLKDPACVFFIADDSLGAPTGQVRFDIKNGEAVISLSVDRRARGRGFGSELIRCASQRLHEERQVRVIHAYTKPKNAASIRAFERAGFSNLGSTHFGAYPAIELIQRLP